MSVKTASNTSWKSFCVSSLIILLLPVQCCFSSCSCFPNYGKWKSCVILPLLFSSLYWPYLVGGNPAGSDAVLLGALAWQNLLNTEGLTQTPQWLDLCTAADYPGSIRTKEHVLWIPYASIWHLQRCVFSLRVDWNRPFENMSTELHLLVILENTTR